MTKVKNKIPTLDVENARIMAELIVDPNTTEHLRVQILNKLLETREGKGIFITMFEENLSFGPCPKCNHENHWAIPEDDLNQMGFVTAESDTRVKKKITANDCDTFQEACLKKKLVM